MKKSISMLICTAVIIAVIYYGGSKLNTPVGLEVIKPAVMYMEEYAEGTGKLIYKDITYVTTGSGGYITRYCVKNGEYVKKGQKIADFTETTAQTLSLPTAETSNLNGIMDIIGTFGYKNSYTTPGEKVKDIEIFATHDGYICDLPVALRETVGSGTAIASISDKKSFEIITDISESVVASVWVGQPVIITGDGFKGSELTGTVTAVSDTAKQTTQGGYTDVTVAVTVETKNASKNIRPGYSANIKILTHSSESAIVLPSESVIFSNGENCVYVFGNGGFEKRNVEIGIENEKGIEIKSGLTGSDIVALSPDINLESDCRFVPSAVEADND